MGLGMICCSVRKGRLCENWELHPVLTEQDICGHQLHNQANFMESQVSPYCSKAKLRRINSVFPVSLINMDNKLEGFSCFLRFSHSAEFIDVKHNRDSSRFIFKCC